MPTTKTPMPYQIPSALRDLVLVDMLELTGSTVAAAQLLNLSQPSVSRRYRRLAAELGLKRSASDRPGQRYGDAEWMRLLRQGVNRHRLASGVLRVGGLAGSLDALPHRHAVQWIPLGPMVIDHWPALLEQELLDAVLLCKGTNRAHLLLSRPCPHVLEAAQRQRLPVQLA